MDKTMDKTEASLLLCKITYTDTPSFSFSFVLRTNTVLRYFPCLIHLCHDSKWPNFISRSKCKTGRIESHRRFSEFGFVPLVLRCGHRGPPGPHRSDAGKHRIESVYTVKPVFTGKWSRWFQKQPGLTGTHRGAKQRRLSPWHHRSSSGMNRISTVRPPGDTVANRHELCQRWS